MSWVYGVSDIRDELEVRVEQSQQGGVEDDFGVVEVFDDEREDQRELDGGAGFAG